MSVEHTAAIWGFVGALVGAAASITATLLTLWHTRQVETDRERRTNVQRNREFQFQTLIRVQEELLKVNKLSLRSLDRDIAIFHRSGHWRKAPIAELHNELHNIDQLDIDLSESMRTCSALIQRVRNETLRGRLDSYVDTIVLMLNARPKQSAEAIKEKLSEELDPLMDEMGVHIRSYAFDTPMHDGHLGGGAR